MKKLLLTSLIMSLPLSSSWAKPNSSGLFASTKQAPAYGKCVGEEIRGICERNPEIVKKILATLGKNDCSTVTKIDLCKIEELMVSYPWREFEEDKNYHVNKITANDLKGLTKLRHLSFEYAGLIEIEEGAFEALKRPVADDCYPYEAKSRARALLTKKQKIGEGYYPYTDEVSAAPCLALLDLSHNLLKVVPSNVFAPLTNIQHIELDSNPTLKMGVMPVELLKGLVHLEEIDFDEMGITAIPADAFNDNDKLSAVDLESNQLTSLPAGLLKFINANSGKVELAGNPMSKTTQGNLETVYKSIDFVW